MGNISVGGHSGQGVVMVLVFVMVILWLSVNKTLAKVVNAASGASPSNPYISGTISNPYGALDPTQNSNLNTIPMPGTTNNGIGTLPDPRNDPGLIQQYGPPGNMIGTPSPYTGK